jgi:resuscitation-promoting factor RpfB
MIKRVMWILALCVLAACTPGASGGMNVRIVVDGRERAYVQPQPISVAQFLQKEGVRLGDFDKVYPPLLSPLTDNTTITIIRVTEREDCSEEDYAYQTLTRKTDELPPGERKVIQAGINGKRRICAKITLEDGTEKGRVPGSTAIISQPRDEIVAIGIDARTLDPVQIAGTIAYISGGQARVIEGNTSSQRTLVTGGGLDGRVFALSGNGRQLLFTRAGTNKTLNELYVMLDIDDPNGKPIKVLEDVLYADWIPGRPYTFGYSTGRWSDVHPDNHEAFNDFIIGQLDAKTGKITKADKVIGSGLTGQYAFWGTQFAWSPDGQSLAWAQADGIGTIDTKTRKINKLFDFKVYSATLPRGWVWLPTLSWSSDGTMLAATVHGPPEGSEQPEASPIFDLRLKPDGGAFEATLAERAGIWARPQFSPVRGDPGEGYLAYLKARDGINSLNSDYDLMIADRDGSNATLVFPGLDKPGLRPVDDFSSVPVWSAEGTQIVSLRWWTMRGCRVGGSEQRGLSVLSRR